MIMKKYYAGITQITLVLGSALLVLSTATIHAQENGFYLGADVGPNFADKLTSDFLVNGSISLNTGIRGDVFVGYAFGLTEHLSLAPELEMGALYNSFGNGTINGQNTTGGGDVVQVPFLANAILNWHFNPRLSIYGGVGVGAEYFDVSVSNSNSPQAAFAGSEGDVAWQAELGLKYKLGPGDLGLGYKYLGFSPLFFNPIANHTVVASYTIHF